MLWRSPWRLVIVALAATFLLWTLFHLDDDPAGSAVARAPLARLLSWGPAHGTSTTSSSSHHVHGAEPTRFPGPESGVKPTLSADQASDTMPTETQEKDKTKDTQQKLSGSKPDEKTDFSEPSPPRPSSGDKVVVVGKTKSEDTSWIVNELPEWQNAIYSVDEEEAPLRAMNKGHEASPYLTYLVDHYDKLPSVIVFMHAHRDGFPKAWHNDAPDYSNVRTLQDLNLDFVKGQGYVNLRCSPFPGCPDEVQPFREWDNQDRIAEHVFGRAWQVFFNNTDIPEKVGTPCCGQFAVTREQVQKRPKAHYERMLSFLHESNLSDGVLGRIYEYMWHVTFGREAVHCPEPRQCYVDLYNRLVLTS